MSAKDVFTGQKNLINENPQKSSEIIPWWILFLILGLSIFFLFILYLTTCSLSLVVIEIILGLSSFVVGILLGFIFGIPKSSVFNQPEPETDSQNFNQSENLSENSNLRYQPSTNLEQISDWLTKIIIGIGLVEFREILDLLVRIGEIVDSNMNESAPNIEILTISIILIFLVLGFISSYLWTRIYYGGIQMNADKGINDSLLRMNKSIKHQNQKIANQKTEIEGYQKITDLLTKGDFVKSHNLTSKNELTEKDFEEIRNDENEWPAELREKVENLRLMEEKWECDPGFDLFPDAKMEMNGRKLVVKIISRPKYDSDSGLIISAEVINVRGEQPLSGLISFLFHPTYIDRVVKVPVKNKKAEIGFYSGGSFTLVAIADMGKTMLSFNLANLPDAPDWFKDQ